MKNRHILSLFIGLLLLPNGAFAQGFKVKAPLDAVTETGFYKIPVTPELTTYAKADLSDIRIAADSSVFVPYINRSEIKKPSQDAFISCPILSTATEGKYTMAVVKNASDSGTASLSFIIANTAVQRRTALSGSDDNNNWYIIDDAIWLTRSYRNNDGNFIQTLSFPFSKYKYFRLKIYNGSSDPLKIVSAGIFKNPDTATVPGYVTNPAASFIQKDSSNHNSYIIIKNKTPYLTGRIALDVTGPKFYDRAATAYVLYSAADSSRINEPVASFTISSGKPCIFNINSQRAYTIIIDISNKDNPPLRVTGVTTSQEQQYLVAYLEKGKNYSLLAGNADADAPQYDLSHFKENIPAVIPTLNYGTFAPVKIARAVTTPPAKNYWLWPTIIIAVILLSFLTYRLMNDMKKSAS